MDDGSAEAISCPQQTDKTTEFSKRENYLRKLVHGHDAGEECKNGSSKVFAQCTHMEIQENIGRSKEPLAFEKIIFVDPRIFGGGNSDDETDDKSVMWLPAAHSLPNMMCPTRSMTRFGSI